MTDLEVKSREPQLAGALVQHIEAVQPAVWAVLLGALIIFSVGFAQPQALHDAAHDARHAISFPCH